MNLVIITTGKRPELLQQTLTSLADNASEWRNHTLTVVMDGWEGYATNRLTLPTLLKDCDSLILHNVPQFASASRNIGAASIPKYRRQEHICFFDDDIFAVRAWDLKLEELLRAFPNAIVTGHAHPFNGSELRCLSHDTGRMIECGLGDVKVYDTTKALIYREPLVISSVNMAMSWDVFDRVGWFLEPGGAGGSEDWNYCDRAVKMGTKLAVTEPEVILHAGQHSSNGKEIVGYAEVCANNQRLLDIHGLNGKVIFG